ncbi:MAG: hypothetical protein ABH819_03640 [Patescibacteria group bacterium]
MQYLHDEQHYTNQYDLLTIKDCLRSIEFFRKSYQEKKANKSLSDKDKLRAFDTALNISLYTQKGEEYRRKQETIRKWMDRDQRLQEKYDSTESPLGIICPQCGASMNPTIKHIDDITADDPKMLFFFECSDCKKKKLVYENGQERTFKPTLCSKCKTPVKVTHSKKGKVITWIYTCPSCHFTEKDIDDFESRDKEWKQQEKHDRLLLEKYRSEFCLSEEEGQKYIAGIEQMKQAMEFFKQQEIKQKDPVYQQVRKLKKVSVVELENKLRKTLEKEKFITLVFDKPELEKFVIVPFNVQDSDTKRKEYDSRAQLKKLIIKTLEGSNWKLMSEGITYRLGYLSGKLKGYEQEDDLVEVIKNEKMS